MDSRRGRPQVTDPNGEAGEGGCSKEKRRRGESNASVCRALVSVPIAISAAGIEPRCKYMMPGVPTLLVPNTARSHGGAGRSPARRWRPASGSRASVVVLLIGRDVHVQPGRAVAASAVGLVVEACQMPGFSSPAGTLGRRLRGVCTCRHVLRENSTLGVCSDI